MRKKQNHVAGDDGVLKIDAQLGGEHHHNSPPSPHFANFAARLALRIADRDRRRARRARLPRGDAAMSNDAAWLICQINAIATLICKKAALDEIDLETLVDLSVALQNASYRVNRELDHLSSANGRAEEKERALENGYVPPEGGAA
jgi:hypothetical protein